MREIKILLAIIVILVAILLVKVFKEDTIPKTTESEYDRKFIIDLLENGKSYSNYSCEYTDLDGKNIVRKFKDNTLLYFNDEITVYQNYNTNKNIVIDKQRDTAKVSEIGSPKLIQIDKLYCQNFLDLIKNDKVEYKYLKQENYEDLECIVIQLKCPKEIDNDLSDATINVWLNEKSGLVTKCNILSRTDKNEAIFKDIDYHLKLEVVTDDDINEPNLKGYTLINLK